MMSKRYELVGKTDAEHVGDEYYRGMKSEGLVCVKTASTIQHFV